MSPFLGTSNPLQYMDWCDVVTVGCLDFPSLDTSTYNTHYIVVMCVVYMSITVFMYILSRPRQKPVVNVLVLTEQWSFC